MAGYTRNPQTVPDDSPGGSTTRQAIADMNNVAIDDLYTGLNAHSDSENGRTHTEIDSSIDNLNAQKQRGASLGLWAIGLTFNSSNEYAVYEETTYKPKISTELPYTTTQSSPLLEPDASFFEPFSDINSANIDDIVLSSVSSTSRSISSRLDDFVNVLDWGAIPDGKDSLSGTEFVGQWIEGEIYTLGQRVQAPENNRGYKCITPHTSTDFNADIANWELGYFSGTDNTKAFEDAINFANTHGTRVLAPSGTYLFSDPDSINTPGNPIINLTEKQNVNLLGDGDTTVFLIDEDCAGRIEAGETTASFLFDTGSNTENPVRGKFGHFVVRGIKIRSRWSHFPGTNQDNFVNGSGFNAFRVEEYKKVVLENITFEDFRQKCTRNRHNSSAVYSNCFGYRLAKGMFRDINSTNIICSGNIIDGAADDALDFDFTPLDGSDSAQEKSSSCMVIDNIISDAEGIIAQSFNLLRICGNVIDRPADTCISCGSQSTNEGARTILQVHGNVITDAIRPYDVTTGEFKVSSDFTFSAINIKGSPATVNKNGVLVGYYDDALGRFITPYDLFEDGSASYTKDSSLVASASGFAISVEDNVVAKTRPNDVMYSEWKTGLRFSAVGFVDAEVKEENRITTGILAQSDIDALSVSGNTVRGVENCLYFRESESVILNNAFTNCIVEKNIFIDFSYGINHSRKGGSTKYSWAIDVLDNLFDGDPWHTHSQRNIDGSWTTPVSSLTDQCGIQARNLININIKGNRFKNVLYPVITSSTASPWLVSTFANNTFEGEPLSTGYNSGNRGIGYIFESQQNKYTIIDSTPQSAGYGSVLNTCPTLTVNAITSGLWVKGAYVERNTPDSNGAKGYLRLTTGEDNVLGVDWKVDYLAYAGGATTSELGNKGSNINANRNNGTRAFLTDTGQQVFSAGTSTTSTWKDSDGAVIITPV